MNNTNCIYVITNTQNGKQYVGVAKDLKRRIYQHSVGHDKDKSYIDNAIVMHGWDSFTYEVIDHYETEEERKQLEQDYIKKYKTHRSQGGYNLTWGGDDACFPDVSGENNPRAQLTKEDVINIRHRRMNGERMSVVFEDYKDKLEGDKRAGFSKVWLHDSWFDVCAEFKGKYPPVDPKYFATIRRNELSDEDLDFLIKYFKWNGPTKYNLIYPTFKKKIDWQSFQETCKNIVDSLYGRKDIRKTNNKNGTTDKLVAKFREELKIEPKYYS